jgi:hypothetical protein
MEPQGLIRICFPRLARSGNCLNNGELEKLYDKVVHPSAVDILPQELTGIWPATWENERYRAQVVNTGQGEGNQVQHTGRDVHSGYLNAFIERMHEYVNANAELEWARSFFFVVEMRGLKTREGSMHMPPEQPALDACMLPITRCFTPTDCNVSTCILCAYSRRAGCAEPKGASSRPCPC